MQVFLTPSGSDAEFLPTALALARAERLGHKVLLVLSAEYQACDFFAPAVALLVVDMFAKCSRMRLHSGTWPSSCRVYFYIFFYLNGSVDKKTPSKSRRVQTEEWSLTCSWAMGTGCAVLYTVAQS